MYGRGSAALRRRKEEAWIRTCSSQPRASRRHAQVRPQAVTSQRTAVRTRSDLRSLQRLQIDSTSRLRTAQCVLEAQHSHAAPQKRSSSAAGEDRLGAQRVCGCCAACLCSVLFYMLSLLHTNVHGQRTRHSHQPHIITAFHQPAHSWSDTSWPPQPAAP